MDVIICNSIMNSYNLKKEKTLSGIGMEINTFKVIYILPVLSVASKKKNVSDSNSVIVGHRLLCNVVKCIEHRL